MKKLIVLFVLLALCGSALAQTPAIFVKWLEASDLIYNKECDSFAIITGLTDVSRDTLWITPNVFMRGNDGGWDTVSMLGLKIDSIEIVDDAVATGHILNGTILGEDMGQEGASSGQVWKWSGSVWEVGDDLTGTGFWTGPGDYVILSSIDDSVGMGTATPSTKLEVVGETKTDTLIVDTIFSIGGDVFNELVGGGLQNTAGSLQVVDDIREHTLDSNEVAEIVRDTGFLETVGSSDLDDSAVTVGKIDHSDAEDNWLDAVYQALEATLTDIADGTIVEDLVNTANPWADNEVDDNITVDEADDVDTTGTKLAAALALRMENTGDTVTGTYDFSGGIINDVNVISGDTVLGVFVTKDTTVADSQFMTKKWIDDNIAAAGGGDVTDVVGGDGLVDDGNTGSITVAVRPGSGIDTVGDLVIVDTNDLNANWVIDSALGAERATVADSAKTVDTAAAALQTWIDNVGDTSGVAHSDSATIAVQDEDGNIINETYFKNDGSELPTGNWSMGNYHITGIDSLYGLQVWVEDTIHTPGGMYGLRIWGVGIVATSQFSSPLIKSYPSDSIITFDDSVTMDGNPLFGLPDPKNDSDAVNYQTLQSEVAAVGDTSLVIAEAVGGSDKIYWDNDTVEIVDDGGDTLRMYHDGTSWVIDGGEGLTIMDSVLVDTLFYIVSPGQTDTTFITNVFLDSVRAGSFGGGGNGGASVEILESNVSEDDPLVILNFMAGFDIDVANDTSYVTLDLTEDQVDLTAEVTGTLPVNKGGTGAATLTDHAVLIGSGTGAISHPGVMINGQVLIGVTGADPVAATISEGEAIDVSEGAGTITISAEVATSANKGVAKFSTDNFSVASGDVTVKDGGIISAELGDSAATVGKIDHSDAETNWLNAVYAPITPDSTEIDTANIREWLTDKIIEMLSGNTVTGIAVTGQDGDNTIDFEVSSDIINHTLDSGEVMVILRDTTYADSNLVGTIVRDTGGILYQPLEATLTDIADGTIIEALTFSGNMVNTANPWADNEVTDALTVTGYMQDEDINTFAELQSWVSDKTLLNEEDAFTIDAGWTFAGLVAADSINTGHLVSGSVYLGNDTLKGIDVLVTDTVVVGGDVIKEFAGHGHIVSGGDLEVDTADAVADAETKPVTGNAVYDWVTAQSYLTGNESITLSGDATGSGATAITVTVVDDLHNHVYSNIDPTTSANWIGRVSDETGTGKWVFATSPTFTTSIIMGDANLSEAELEILDGATPTTTELNYVDGVTSAIQTQLDAKEVQLDDEAGLYAVLSDVSDFVQPGDVAIGNFIDTTTLDTIGVAHKAVNADTATYSSNLLNNLEVLGDLMVSGNIKHLNFQEELDLSNAFCAVPVDSIAPLPIEVIEDIPDSRRDSIRNEGMALHPSNVYVPGGWPRDNPHPYWMAFNPWPDGYVDVVSVDNENPHIACSDDGISWTSHVGAGSDSITNPIYTKDSITDCSHLSDQELFFDAEGDLWLAFRATVPTNMQRIYVMSSSDGISWGDTSLIVNDSGNRALMSPSIILDTMGTYKMWIVDGDFDPNRIALYNSVAPDTGWQQVGIALDLGGERPTGLDLWHIEVIQFSADILLGLFYFCDSAQQGNSGGLYLAKSTDRGVTWDVEDDPLLEERPSGWGDHYVYRMSGFWQRAGTGEIQLKIYYSARKTGGDTPWWIGQPVLMSLEPDIDTTDADLLAYVTGVANDTADVVRSEFPTPKYMFNLANPDALYAIDHEWSIDPETEAAITIDSFRVTLDADPTTELTFSLKYADAFIGFANAVVIDDTATVAGVTDVTGGFGDATVPAGKCIYLLFDADPDDAITQASVKIYYTID